MRQRRPATSSWIHGLACRRPRELVGADHAHVVGQRHAGARRRDERQAFAGRGADPQRHVAGVGEPARRRSARRASGARPGSGRARPRRCSPTGGARRARRSPPAAAWCGSPTGSSAGPARTTGSCHRPRRRSESVTRSTLGRPAGRRAPSGGEVTPTAAVGDVRAAGVDAVGRRLDDAHDRAPVGAVTPADHHLDQLAGQGVVDQHDPPVVPPGQGRPAGDQPLGPHDLGLAGRAELGPVTRTEPTDAAFRVSTGLGGAPASILAAVSSPVQSTFFVETLGCPKNAVDSDKVVASPPGRRAGPRRPGRRRRSRRRQHLRLHRGRPPGVDRHRPRPRRRPQGRLPPGRHRLHGRALRRRARRRAARGRRRRRLRG